MQDALTFEERLRIAKKWSNKVLERYDGIIKAIILVGSVSRLEFTNSSDIDLVVIIDDTREDVSKEFLEKIDRELEIIAYSMDDAKVKMETENGEKKERSLLEIFPVYTLTEFWDYVRKGHPLVQNIIKEGIALYDTGFFEPLQRLWLQGKIPLTKEAIEGLLERAKQNITRAKVVKIMQLTEDCYYAIVNSAQALFMAWGYEPPPPTKLYKEMKNFSLTSRILDDKYVEWIREIVELRKKVKNYEILEIKGEIVDMWIKRAEEFVGQIEYLIKLNEINELGKIVLKTDEVIYKAVIKALSSMGIPIEDPIRNLEGVETLYEFDDKRSKIKEEDIERFKREFKKVIIDSGYLDASYLKLWERVEELRKIIKAGDIEKLNDEEIVELREETRKFIRKLSKIVDGKVK